MKRMTVITLAVFSAMTVFGELADLNRTCECRPRGGVPNAQKKLESGETVKIAYLGGSITEAGGGWRVKTLKWFQEQFPKATVVEVNAALSGTGSDYGAIRLKRDVLVHSPDLMFVEFRVNGSAGYDYQTVEGIIRQARAVCPKMDICFVYTLCESMLGRLSAGNQTGFGVAMETLCEHYGIASIDFAPEIVERLKDPSKFVFRPTKTQTSAIVFAKDGTHPGDAGHEIYKEVLARSFLNHIFKVKHPAKIGSAALPPAHKPNAWTRCAEIPARQVLTGAEWTAITDGRKDPVYGDSFGRTDRMLRGGMWTAKEGATFKIDWEGTVLGFSDIPQAKEGMEPIVIAVSIDGGKSIEFNRRRTREPRIYSRFVFLPEQPNGRHTAVFTIKRVPAGQRCVLGQFLSAGGEVAVRHSVPSPSACVRACPQGAASPKRNWNGISPIVKRWELDEREKVRAKVAACPPPPQTSQTSLPGYATVEDLSANRCGVDLSRVALVGDAGALRTAALDERIAMVVSLEEECSDDVLRLIAPRLAYVPNVKKESIPKACELYAAYGLRDRLVCGGDAKISAAEFADRLLKAPSSADSDAIDARIRAACKDGTRAVTLGKNPASTDGAWHIVRAILVPDDFTLVFDGCTVELAYGTQDNLIRNEGAAEGAAKPNRGIRILGRNGATLSGGKRNHYLPRRSGDPNGWRSVGILLCDVSDYEIGGLKFGETQCWAISQERCYRGRVHDLVFGSTDLFFNQDGVDVRKGCHDLVIENISGSTGDDAVALTAYRDPPGTPARYGMQIGGNSTLGERDDVHNVTIRNISAKSAGGHGVIRLLVCDGIKMHHISVENVVDTATGKDKRPQATIRIGDVSYHKTRRCQMGEMHNITVRNVHASGKVAVWIKGPLCDSEITGIVPAPNGRRYDRTAPIERVRLDAE